MGLCSSKQHGENDGGQAPAAKRQSPDSAADPSQIQLQVDTPGAGQPQRSHSTESGEQPAAAAGTGSAAASPQPGAAPAERAGSSSIQQQQGNGAIGTAVPTSPPAAGPGQQLGSPAAAAATSTSPAAAAAPSDQAAGGTSMLGGAGAGGVGAAAAGTAVVAGAAPAVAAGNGVSGSPSPSQAQTPFQQQQQAVNPQQQAELEQQQQQPGVQLPPKQKQGQALHQWDRAASAQAPSALSSAGSAKAPAQSARSVKFADPPPDSDDSSQQLVAPDSSVGISISKARRVLPRRSASSSKLRSGTNEVSEAVLAHQAEILRSNKAGKLRMRRGGLDSSFAALQDSLTQDEAPVDAVATRAAGLKHIGFGPFKRENQDEFFIQVGDFGGMPGANLFCVFDGHGSNGKDAALFSRQLLPRLLDVELRKYFMRVAQDTEHGLRGAVEVIITEVFGETERSLTKSGVNLASSGTTASVAFQRGNRLWVAAAGDSRAILCTRNAREQWRALPLTIDHRPRRPSERERIEAAGARVAPKRLPSGRSVGEPRLWLQDTGGPGLLLSRSLGDLTAATVGCTSDPEVTFTTLRPHVDQVLIMATDGVWDVLTNEQVCDIVVESPDPHIACRRVLDAALYEWEERMSADNITVLVVEFEWAPLAEQGAAPRVTMDQVSAPAPRVPDAALVPPALAAPPSPPAAAPGAF